MRFETAMLSEAGSRPENQDAVIHRVAGARHCWAVADGLGGHGGGGQAARLAIEQVPADESLEVTFARAHAVLMARQRSEPALAHMRTTLVVLNADEEKAGAQWGHVGDSRLYHFRGRRVVARTADHSFAQTLAAAGHIAPDAIRHHEDRSKLLRALGSADCRAEAAAPVTLEPGDAFLLASDGFWEPIVETEMEEALAGAATPAEWLHRLRTRIFSQPAEDRDNLSAIAIFTHAT